MCYGIGCKYESFMGECRKPSSKKCPQDYGECQQCGDYFDDDEINENGLCKKCVEYLELEEE